MRTNEIQQPTRGLAVAWGEVTRPQLRKSMFLSSPARQNAGQLLSYSSTFVTIFNFGSGVTKRRSHATRQALPLAEIFMKPFIFTTAVLLICLTNDKLFGQRNHISSPLIDFLSERNDTSYPNTIHKIIYDFNSDGLLDIALSSSDSWGNAGGNWDFYFKNIDKSYRYYGEIDILHPKAYSIKRQKSKPNILLVYGRSSGSSGALAFYSITKKGFKLIKVKMYGEKEEIKTVEKLYTELDRGEVGIWKSADLKCLLLKKKGCWD